MIELNINEEAYINEHLKRRGQILDNIDKALSNKEVKEINVWQGSWKIGRMDQKRKGVVICCKNGDVVDIRHYETKINNKTNTTVYASAMINKRWRWLGVVSNDETVCNLVKNVIERTENLKKELDNKVAMQIKAKYERIGIKRG
ncbi:MAG: hypothetical protein GXN95_05795 [Methanococci archaeon]|nr:hypothetical protein [Methanococci archaeon]